MIFSTFMRCSLNFLRCTFSEERVSGAYKSGITATKSNMLKAEEIRHIGIYTCRANILGESKQTITQDFFFAFP
jgi:hypothetical protein